VRLTVVGSGTVAPHAARVCSGYWIETTSMRLLIDCGCGVLHRLATLNLPWSLITHIAISHFHYDHVGDLPALLMAMKWGQLPPRTEPLTLVGPGGVREWLERLAGVHGGWVSDPGFPLGVVDVSEADSLDLGAGVTLAARRVPHTPESVAYSVASGRARVVYTGDTGDDEALGAWASECDVLVAECSLPTALAIREHLTPETAGVLAARARPRRLVLTHFYPPVEREDIVRLVRERWNGPVVLARDGTTVDLPE
jgi:ribonuclease BN (tRNA processing enzyme)